MRDEDGEQVASSVDVVQWAFAVVMLCGYSPRVRALGAVMCLLIFAMRWGVFAWRRRRRQN